MKESVATSWRMSSIGNSGARSSGPTGWPVPGCSGGGGGEGRSGITLYHCRGISDSSSVIFVCSLTAPSSRRSFPHPTPPGTHPDSYPPSASSGDQRLYGGGELGHGLFGVGEVHAGLGVEVQLVLQARVAGPHRPLDHDDRPGLV